MVTKQIKPLYIEHKISCDCQEDMKIFSHFFGYRKLLTLTNCRESNIRNPYVLTTHLQQPVNHSQSPPSTPSNYLGDHQHYQTKLHLVSFMSFRELFGFYILLNLAQYMYDHLGLGLSS